MPSLANTMENQGFFYFFLKKCFLSISPSRKNIKIAQSVRLAEDEEKGSEMTINIYVSGTGVKRLSEQHLTIF